ncbi:hypothetical protein V1264_021386 [Littorina saxatilis]|uniref:Uncharacterized protein n=2 Tax=Littorina saxatilis TaxID=31220 RepID=A0AAN9FVP0_9CAEN
MRHVTLMMSRRKPLVCVLLLVCWATICVTYILLVPLSCANPRNFPKLDPRDNTDVTIVTAFFDLGTFQKGEKLQNIHYTPQKYLEWARAFRYLQNPLLIFTDSSEMEDCFRGAATVSETLREKWSNSQKSGTAETKREASEKKNRVKVVRIYNRTELFAFKKLKRVREIFADPSYPKFHPNTVLPEYACTQHAKVDLMERAILEDYFHTKYYAWIDLGYFRDTSSRKRKFWITVPPAMDDKKVAVNEVRSPHHDLDPGVIFKENVYWVGGGMILGSAPVVLKYVAEYRRAVDFFMDRGLFNTDQQVIYAMYKSTATRHLAVTTQLQLFGNKRLNCWFYLGYQCYRE